MGLHVDQMALNRIGLGLSIHCHCDAALLPLAVEPLKMGIGLAFLVHFEA